MKFDQTDGKSFIDNMSFGTHSILLYEQEDDCLAVQFKWLQNGMKKYQYAVFLTHEDPHIIENKIYNFGIDVDKHKGSLLDVIQIPDMMSEPESVLSQFEKMMKTILHRRGPCRITGRSIQNIDSREGKLAELSIEKKAHNEFDRCGVSILYPYPMSKIKDQNEIVWAKEIIQNHDSFIYVSQQGDCTSIDPNFITSGTQSKQENIL